MVGKDLMKGSTALLALSLLAEGEQYGYQMIAELKRRSDGTFNLKEGTLYPVLHGLENDGAVESFWVDSDEGRRRKYYRITRYGRKLLEEKRGEWTAYARAVGRVIGGARHA